MDLHRPWVQHALHANYSPLARGVSILVSKSVLCTIHQVISDPGDQYLAVVMDIFYHNMVIVNFYVPPPFQFKVLYELLPKLAPLCSAPYDVYGGL